VLKTETTHHFTGVGVINCVDMAGAKSKGAHEENSISSRNLYVASQIKTDKLNGKKEKSFFRTTSSRSDEKTRVEHNPRWRHTKIHRTCVYKTLERKFIALSNPSKCEARRQTKASEKQITKIFKTK
jgi:hypothetical protein